MYLVSQVEDVVDAPFATVVAVLPTPFAPDGTVDEGALVRIVDHARAGGIAVLTVNGNTGEYWSLTPDERAIARDTVLAAAGTDRVVVGVGGDLQTAAAEAREAARCGAAAIMVHEPLGPFRSRAGWLGYFQAVSDAAAGTPMIPYVKDAMVDSRMLETLFDRCPDVTAVKYAVPDVLRFGGLVADLGDRVTWLCGLAELWAPPFWALGAEGFTSGLASFAPRVALTLLDELRTGAHDAARASWNAIRPLELLRARDGGAPNVPAVKEALHQIGLADRAVRPPITPLSEPDREAVRAVLVSIGGIRVGSIA